ncbi:MAG: hypothetical protein ACOVJ4_01510 [Sphingobacteriaceae bacterium]|jgi:hypothetical protein
MKTTFSYFLLFFLLITQVVAQVPNSQRKKPVKKKKVKVEAPIPVVLEPVKEPSKEETEAWIIEKILKFKPIIYITGNLANKNNCEYPVMNVAFSTEDLLVLTLKSDPRNACYLDELKQVTIDITKIDFKRSNSVESTKRVLLYPEKLEIPFALNYSAKSQLNKIKYVPFNVIIAFDKGATYEPNLATRLARALLKLHSLIPVQSSVKELY